jgi:hypothetical protein
MFVETRTLDSAIINSQKENAYSIGVSNVTTHPSSRLNSTSDSFAVKAKRILRVVFLRKLIKRSLNEAI